MFKHLRLVLFIIASAVLVGAAVAPGGEFFEVPSYPAGGELLWVAAGDFNGDGKADVAVTDQCDNCFAQVDVLLGNGDGSFRLPVIYGVPPGVGLVVVADFNGDGKQDLAVNSLYNQTVSVLMGNGDGTFQPHADYQTGLGPMALAVGDFNGDGKPDLAVVANRDQRVRLQ